jgi:hypothetical protein
MNKRMLLRLVGGAALGLSFGLPAVSTSAWADTLDEIKKAGKIRIAIDTAIPPFGMTDDKMQPTGSDVDLATHEMGFARRVADVVVFMHQGKVWETGPTADVFAKPWTAEFKQFVGSER